MYNYIQYLLHLFILILYFYLKYNLAQLHTHTSTYLKSLSFNSSTGQYFGCNSSYEQAMNSRLPPNCCY